MKAMKDVESWTGAPPDRWYAFYVRQASTQSVAEEFSIPNQLARVHEVAAQRGWIDYRIYVEPENVSAAWWIDNRPAFHRIVDDILAGRIVGLCARHLDRIARGTETLLKLLSLLKAHSVGLWDFEEQLKHQDFTMLVLGSAAKFEKEVKREMKGAKAHHGGDDGREGTP